MAVQILNPLTGSTPSLEGGASCAATGTYADLTQVAVRGWLIPETLNPGMGIEQIEGSLEYCNLGTWVLEFTGVVSGVAYDLLVAAAVAGEGSDVESNITFGARQVTRSRRQRAMTP